MEAVKKTVQRRKRIIPSGQAGSYIDTETVLLRNRILENAALESFLIRFPRLRLHVHFYYRFIENGGVVISTHGHQHWEISRICLGVTEYSVVDGVTFRPGSEEYLIIPPKRQHGWKMLTSPLLSHSWQVQMDAEDSEGEGVLDALATAVEASGFRIPASSAQIQAEALLWQMSGKAGSPQLFGPVLSGFARIVLGDLIARINPWPEGMLELKSDPQEALINLAGRMKVFLDENLSHPVTLSDMESHFHYSGRHLNRIFQEVYHCPIGHYLRDQRIELARRWLSTTDRAVKDIALSLGYSSSSQFCRYFLEHAGSTPSDYRKVTQTLSQEQALRSVQSPDR